VVDVPIAVELYDDFSPAIQFDRPTLLFNSFDRSEFVGRYLLFAQRDAKLNPVPFRKKACLWTMRTIRPKSVLSASW